MATALGTLTPFVPDEEHFDSYVERLDAYFVANDIDDENKQVAVLLNCVGAKSYGTLKDLTSPDLPKTKKYDELVNLLQEHLSPKPVLVAERYRFNLRFQEPGESVSVFLASLRRLSKHCKYGNILDDMLRDRFIVGLRSEAMKKRLLSEKDLTLSTAVEIAKAMETAAKDAATIGASANSTPNSSQLAQVNFVKRRPYSKQSKGGTATRPSTQPNAPSRNGACYRCGDAKHMANECPFKTARCNKCHMVGHIARSCRGGGKKSNQSSSTKQSQSTLHATNLEDDLDFNSVQATEEETVPDPKAMLKVHVNGQALNMELDTGASVTLVSQSDIKVKMPLKRTHRKLRSATGQWFRMAGEATVCVNYEGRDKWLKLYVSKDKCPALFGRSWIRAFFGPNWLQSLLSNGVNKVEAPLLPNSIQDVLNKYNDAFFKPGLGLVQGFRAHLTLKEGARPKFCKARNVPYAMRSGVEAALNKMVDEGQLEKVAYTDFATPIVPVPKPDSSVRICGDYKVTLNPMLELQRHPMPRQEDCTNAMNGGERFTKIDLAMAYNQCELDDTSKALTTLNTPMGLFRWTRLPFGISSSPGIFQELIDKTLAGIPNCVSYLDDILLTGKDEAEHAATLDTVLSRLSDRGFRGRLSKCTFYAKDVEYLGFLVDKDGTRPKPDKIKAIMEMPPPENLDRLESVVGGLNYYSKYIPRFSTLMAPLNKLRQKDVPYVWGREQQVAFDCLKQQLSSTTCLVHYNPDLQLILDCDASSVGVGCVLSHRMKNGDERPICFSSATLNKSQQNYSQIEKEALAIVFGVKRNAHYLMGNKFILRTDHRPLTTIFHPEKGISAITASRLQRWAIILMGYNYEIQFRPTKQHGNCDSLSRLPLPTETILAIESEDARSMPFEADILDFKKIAVESAKDEVLMRIMAYVKHGWPAKEPSDLQPWFQRSAELTMKMDVYCGANEWSFHSHFNMQFWICCTWHTLA